MLSVLYDKMYCRTASITSLSRIERINLYEEKIASLLNFKVEIIVKADTVLNIKSDIDQSDSEEIFYEPEVKSPSPAEEEVENSPEKENSEESDSGPPPCL